MDYIDDNRVNVIYQIPLAEIVFDFFDGLSLLPVAMLALTMKSPEYRSSKLVKMDILLNGDKGWCSQFYRSQGIWPYERGKLIVEAQENQSSSAVWSTYSSRYRSENRGSYRHQGPA